MPSNPSNVEERVVEMRIDNKNFESGAKKTINILEKLEKALKIKSDVSAIDDLAKATSKYTSSQKNMAEGLDQVQAHFSALEVAGLRVIQNLTDAVYNFVSRTVKGLTIDQVSAGWNKYERMIEATQTIMAATASEVGEGLRWENQEQQMADIQKYLDGLLWYADETSYSFNDMTDNLGKFLSAGVGLEDAYKAMMGISSWGATAGAKPAEVSRAMYNISQAMGTGVMQNIDWKSIENANMATLDFKRNALAVAQELGRFETYISETVGKEGYIAKGAVELNEADYIIEKTDEEIEDMIITAENFRSTLDQKWFDKDVMTVVFERYGRFAEALRNVTSYGEEIIDQQTGEIIPGLYGANLEATQMLELLTAAREEAQDASYAVDWKGWALEALGDDSEEAVKQLKALVQVLDDVGIAIGDYSETGFRMGQEAKTFTDAIEATKDAVSSQWMKTFEYIFGNYLQAKDFWTDVTGELWEIFASGGKRRNEILKIWSQQTDEFGRTGRDYLLGNTEDFQGALWNILDAIRSVTEPIKEAFAEVFGFESAQAGAEKLRELTAQFRLFAASLGLSEDGMSGLKRVATAVFKVLKFGLTITGKLFLYLVKVADELGHLFDILLQLIDGTITPQLFFAEIGKSIKKLLPTMDEVKDGFKNLWKTLKNIATSENVLNFFGTLWSLMKQGWNNLKQWVTSLTFTDVVDFFRVKLENLGNTITDLANQFMQSHPKIAEWFENLKENSILVQILGGLTLGFEKLSDTLSNLHFDGEGVKEFFDLLAGIFAFLAGPLIGDPKELKEKIVAFVETAYATIKEEFTKLAPQSFGDLLKAIKTAFIVVALTELGGFFKALRMFMYDFDDLGVMASQVLKSVRNAFDGLATNLRAGAYIKMAAAVAIIAGVIYLLSKMDDEQTEKAMRAAIMIGGIMLILSKMMSGGGIRFNKGVNVSLFGKAASVVIGLGLILGALAGLFLIVRDMKVGDFLWKMGAIAGLIIIIGVVALALNKLAVFNSRAVNGTLLALSFSLDLLIPIFLVLAHIPADRYDAVIWSVIGLLVTFGALMWAMSKIASLQKNDKSSKTLGQNMVKMAESMLILVVALDLLIPLIKQLGSMGAIEFGRAYAGILVILVTLTALMYVLGVMSNKIIDPGKLVLMSVAMLLISASILVLAPAMATIAAVLMGLIPAVTALEDFWQTMLKLAVVTAIVVALGFGVSLLGKGMLLAAAAVAVFALGLGLLAIVLPILAAALPDFIASVENVDWRKLGKGVLIFVGLAAALGVIAWVVSKIAKTDTGKGIASFVTKLTGSLLTLAKKLGTTLEELMPYFLEMLGVLLVMMGAYLIDIMPEIVQLAVDAVVTFFSSLADAIEGSRGELVESITKIVRTVVGVISDVITELFTGEGWEESSLLEKILLGGGALSIGASILSKLLDPLKSVKELLVGGGKGSEGLIKSVGKFFGEWKTGIELIGGGSFAAGIGVIAGLAAALAYSIKMVGDQKDQLRGEAFEGLGDSFDDYATALERAHEAQEKARKSFEEYAGSGFTEGADMLQQEADARYTVYHDILKEYAKTLNVTTEELEKQAKAHNWNIRETEAYKAHVEELKKEEENLTVAIDEETEAIDSNKKETVNWRDKLDELRLKVGELPEVLLGAKDNFEAAGSDVGGAGATAVIDAFLGTMSDEQVENVMRDSTYGPMIQSYLGANDVIDENSDALANNWVTGLFNAITSGELKDIANGAGANITYNVAKGANDEIDKNVTTVARNAVVGFANKIFDSLTLAASAGTALGKSVLLGATGKSALDENSPSKAMARIAEYAVLGLTNELNDQEGNVFSAGDSIGATLKNALMQAMADVGLLADENFDISPVVTPIVDMSNVTSAASGMDGMFGSYGYGVSSNMSRSIQSRLNAVERLAASVNETSGNHYEGDNFTFNIYASEGMSEEAIADAVMNRMQQSMARRRVAFG